VTTRLFFSHNSDGWDRTPQVCSLAQIILDPYCRTRGGFITLICKEWISFGHQFASRTHGHDKKECSPVFLQWIDCVWQIARRFQTAFEFNTHFLLTLIDRKKFCFLLFVVFFKDPFHPDLYLCDTGTFCVDSERECVEQFLAHRFQSLWSRLLGEGDEVKAKYSNPLYVPVATVNGCCLFGCLFVVCFVVAKSLSYSLYGSSLRRGR
jgi:hypothetical protein